MANKVDPILGEYRQDDASIVSSSAVYLKLDQTTPQTIVGLTDGYLKLTSGVLGTGAVDLSAYLPVSGATSGATSQSQAFTNGITLNATSIVTDTTTGIKIGTATNQKIGFYNNTPIVKPTATTDLGTVLSNLGLRVAGTAYPITTSGTSTFSGTLKHSGSTLSFYNSTGITKPAATVDLGTVLSNLGLRTAGTAYPLTTSGAIDFSGTVGLGVTTITNTSTAALKVTGTNGDAFTVDTTNLKVIVGGATHQIGFSGEEDLIVLTSGTITAKVNAVIALSGTGYVDSPSYKAGGTAPVADGTYTVGLKLTGGGVDGTITTKGGIITAIQAAT